MLCPAMLPPVSTSKLLVLVRKRDALVVCVDFFHLNKFSRQRGRQAVLDQDAVDALLLWP